MRSYLLIFAAAALWGLIGTVSRGIIEAGVTPLEIAFWRALLAGGFFTVHALIVKQYRLQSGRDGGIFFGFALVGVVIFYSAFTLAVEAGGVSLATVLLYSASAFVALFAWLLLREALTPRKMLLVALAITGIVFVSQDAGSGISVTPLALFWGLMAGVSYASYYIFGKFLLGRYEPVTIYAIILPLGALMLFPLVTFAPKSPTVWGLLALLSFFSTYLAYLVYFTGLKRVEASRAVLVATVEPVIAAALAAVIFGERFGIWGYLGSALVLLTSALAALPQRQRVVTQEQASSS